MSELNPVVDEHCKAGGVAAFCDNGYFTIKKGDWKIRITKTNHIPITFNGTVDFMIQNALAATLAVFLWGFKTEDIRTALETFSPSHAQTPGRMNLFEFKDFKILVDYAHNPDGLKGIQGFLNTANASFYTGVIAGTGDRRDDDIREMGRQAAKMFDEIVVCQENYLRGRTREEIASLIIEGALEINANIPHKIMENSTQAWEYVTNKIRPGELLTITSSSIHDAYQKVKHLQDLNLYEKI
jgi:cyanophycin synthetase